MPSRLTISCRYGLVATTVAQRRFLATDQAVDTWYLPEGAAARDARAQDRSMSPAGPGAARWARSIRGSIQSVGAHFSQPH
ncbi:MAG TPA: hypothetical protein VHL31_05500 [Geminicoccus sp.]|uniref:hypothetical protein n=1 Tax=Geminicoccus sp. TaxID=2024832 RepID=UPI002E332964|nr:hypothetical protein [Geminicoccus sp.]HEX2525743.1 hypothetical protein [Geminicoccus sp.]